MKCINLLFVATVAVSLTHLSLVELISSLTQRQSIITNATTILSIVPLKIRLRHCPEFCNFN